MTIINQYAKRSISIITAVVLLLAIAPIYSFVTKAEDANTVHVRMDPNGGSFIRNGLKDTSIQDFSFESGDCYVRENRYDYYSPLDGDYWAAPEGSNLVFDGWTKDKEGNRTLEYGGTLFAPNEDKMLYAKWVKPSERKNYVTLTFDDNGYATFVSDESINQITRVVKKGSIIDAPSLNADHKEYGWYFDRECTKLVPRDNSEFFIYTITANESVTLYAGAAKYNAVTFQASEGSYYNEQKARVEYFLDNQTLNSYFRDCDPPSLDNKVIAGWYYDKSYTKRVKSSDVLTDNMTLYAKWSDPVTITLKYESGFFEGFGSDPVEIIVPANIPLSESFDYLTEYCIVSKNGESREYISDTTKVYSDSALKKRIDLTKTYPKNNDVYYLDLTPQQVLVGFYCGEGGLTLGDMPSDYAAYAVVNKNYSSIWEFLNDWGFDVCTPGETIIEGFYKDELFKEKYPDNNIVFTKPTFIYVKYKTSSSASNSDNAKLNGIVKGFDGKWAMYKNGRVDTSYTGVAKNENGWWRVEKGYVNFNAQGIYKNDYGWWKTTDGKVTFKEIGVFKNDYGWWRVKDSKVDFKANGIYKNKYGWWKTTDGKVTFKENGVFKNEYGWWKVKNSKVDFNFTGIAKNKFGSWYIKNGKVDFNKNGKVNYNGKTYRVTDGKATLG